MYPAVFVYILFVLHTQIARMSRTQRIHSRRHTAPSDPQRYHQRLTGTSQRDRVSASAAGSEQDPIMPEIQVCPSSRPTRIILRMGRPPAPSGMLGSPVAPSTQVGPKIRNSHHSAAPKPRTREDWLKCLRSRKPISTPLVSGRNSARKPQRRSGSHS
ncbi:hypothetical protein N7468_009831 [Penicillium chermesinum]|uniref:Uncharacterized protein n=1 Tax=Penicillium chermesinum TaxID=63820 RepID=A0A9W9NBJ7_9EURO|nr:uncharacterized protein N7468_009831 [Penicillium chermesinum]KAJ5216823.1 hypothetical protein N7468_009831 [Penicillium chermesinum]